MSKTGLCGCAGTLCPEPTVTGSVTQYPASDDGEAESGLELPLSGQNGLGTGQTEPSVCVICRDPWVQRWVGGERGKRREEWVEVRHFC